jgi:tetratricopeptide (TPR) repeat protein
MVGELRGRGEPPFAAPIEAFLSGAEIASADYCRRCARLGKTAAEALAHAHRLGVVHRDVKPANLMVDGQGHVFVTDFGLASVRTRATGVTHSGDLVGTLRYMSPEQAKAAHRVVDHRTDVYSLGATLYEMLTLERAFPGETTHDLLRAIVSDVPEPPRRKNGAVPADLETIVVRAMAKEPADRYATATDLAEDLGRFLDDRPIVARRAPRLAGPLRWARRHRGVATTCVLLLLAAGVVGALLYPKYRRDARIEELWKAIRAAKKNDAYLAQLKRRDADAVRLYLLHLEHRRALLELVPGDVQNAQFVVRGHAQVADCLMNLGRLQEVTTHIELATTIARRLAAHQAGRGEHELHHPVRLRARFAWLEGDLDEAVGAYEDLVRVMHADIRERDHRYAWAGLVHVNHQLGLLHLTRGDQESAAQCFRKAIAVEHPFVWVNMCRAWTLARCPIEELRDPAKALELAERAVEQEDHWFGPWRALGAARYASGDHAGAIEALEKSMSGSVRGGGGGNGLDWYLLAMALWKSGDEESARRWFRRSESQSDVRGLDCRWCNEDVRLLREEAAKLLEIH